MVNDKQSDKTTYWHPAFRAAIKLELEQYKDVLDFQFEVPLNTEPLKIDAIIIKKIKDVEIKKNIAAIFRTDNIVEFKSPGDYLSIDDFYKVYAYACLYKVTGSNVVIEDISITMIENRHPASLFEHLQQKRGYSITEAWPGIYHVKGDVIPIQIIETKRLEETENMWLASLRDKLETSQYRIFADVFLPRRKEQEVETYLYALLNEHPEIITEVEKMADKLTLEDVLVRDGWTARWETKAKEEDARNALALGLPVDTVQKITGLDTQTIQGLASR
jgi:hypothetical protein